MYRHTSKSRYGHFWFILLDLLCLNLGFFVAYMLRINAGNPYRIDLYRHMLIIMCLVDVGVILSLSTLSDVTQRGYYKEFISLAKQSIIVFLLGVFYLYTVKDAHKFSRLTLALMGVIYFPTNYLLRLGLKQLYKRYFKSTESSLLVFANLSNAESVVESIKTRNDGNYHISGLVIMDRDMTGQIIGGIHVVSPLEEAALYVCHNWVDEVLVVAELGYECPETVLRHISETGVVLHVGISRIKGLLGQKQFVENIGDYSVVTSCMNQALPLELLVKRVMDIAGGIAGCLITLVLYVFIAPMIKLASPGPALFAQKRVGRNGKVFTIYKFRSMYLDAEERKRELAAQNKISDGMMFKMDFDPRVIGNRIMPDGSQKTGIGNFIRRTSLDEFPQFLNVLRGEMSLVGTRPPTVDEWEKYGLHHRARMAIKPGITGLWQISGRSDITDFEEVVELDKEYINTWSIGQDIKILLKTVGVIIKGRGAM